MYVSLLLCLRLKATEVGGLFLSSLPSKRNMVEKTNINRRCWSVLTQALINKQCYVNAFQSQNT